MQRNPSLGELTNGLRYQFHFRKKRGRTKKGMRPFTAIHRQAYLINTMRLTDENASVFSL
jgi:hypothetical protein